MSNLRSIEIDFDVHKLIENERNGFDEPPNAALRRLLGLKEADSIPKQSPQTPTPAKRDWSDQGATLPHGTAVRMNYNGHSFSGRIIDGRWVIGTMEFESPSGAASGVGLTRKGKTTRLDGWKYWEIQKPGEDTWASLDSLRSRPPPLTLDDLGL